MKEFQCMEGVRWKRGGEYGKNMNISGYRPPTALKFGMYCLIAHNNVWFKDEGAGSNIHYVSRGAPSYNKRPLCSHPHTMELAVIIQPNCPYLV
jgi:hypothetical protein